jgi:hypothetical protein
MKTVIQVYKIGYANVECNDRDNFHGIGDFLRATLGMYRLSKIYNFRLIVDYSLHPIGKYIESSNHGYDMLVKESKINLLVGDYEIMEYINTRAEDVLVFFGWHGTYVYDYEITHDEREFMKSILVPTKIMQDYIDLKLAEIPFKNFTIVHYRLGDDELVRSSGREYRLDHIVEPFGKNDILLSDSKKFKDFVEKSGVPVFMFKDPVYHLGHAAETNIQHTLFEFFLVIHADHIKSYTVYDWESGFVKAISMIYQKSLEAGKIVIDN